MTDKTNSERTGWIMGERNYSHPVDETDKLVDRIFGSSHKVVVPQTIELAKNDQPYEPGEEN